MIADRHYWSTAAGGLVPTGHLDAEVLAYPAGTELPDDVARELGLLDPPKPASKPAAKQAERPAAKQASKSANK